MSSGVVITIVAFVMLLCSSSSAIIIYILFLEPHLFGLEWVDDKLVQKKSES